MDLGNRNQPSRFETYHEQVLKEIFKKEAGVFHKNLYPHQIKALKSIKTHDFQQNQNAMIVMPTGTGKSVIIALAPYVLNSHKTLIVTPSKTISGQLYADMCHMTKNTYLKRGLVLSEDLKKFIPHGELITSTSQITHRKLMEVADVVVANAQKFTANTSSVDLSEIPNDLYDLVIVDEAHHYPAATWARIVHHFPNSKRLFLTATPHENENATLHVKPCFQLTRKTAVENRIIRALTFEEGKGKGDPAEFVVTRMLDHLKIHDEKDSDHQHKGLILTRTKDKANHVVTICNDLTKKKVAAPYHGDSNSENTIKKFENNGSHLKILVVCGKLIEGYDHANISVVGILRNVQPQSKVLFTQFVGRCVRRCHSNEEISGVVLSHAQYEQKQNFKKLDQQSTVDPELEE